MPDPTDPLTRLDRLAPSIDVDAAASAYRVRRSARTRRRRALVGGALGVAVVAVGIGAALALPRDDSEQVLTGSTTEPEPIDITVPVGIGQDERRTSTEADGIVLALHTPVEAEVGQRMWVDVTLTNGRSAPIAVDVAAACHEPLGAVAGSVEAVSAVEADTGFGAFDADAPGGSGVTGTGWTGDLDELPSVLSGGSDPKVYSGRDQSLLSMSSIACDAMRHPPETIEPGGSISRRIAIDLRWVTPTAVDGQELEVLATTGPIVGDDGADLGKVTVRQPVVLRDPVDRQASYDAAVGPDGIAAAPTLPAWVAEVDDLGPDAPPEMEQAYLTGLSWWDGAWEAWLRPERGIGHQTDPLRIRFDGERMEVVDVRTVFGNGAPSDDPDRAASAAPVDDVRYRAG